MATEAYQTEYNTFVQNYKFGQMNGEQVGEEIMKMVQYFCDLNLSLTTKEELLNRKASEDVDKVDEATGKAVSVSKAELTTKASPEYTAYAKAKSHLQNVEQIINALKALQKGVMNEYAHMGGI